MHWIFFYCINAANGFVVFTEYFEYKQQNDLIEMQNLVFASPNWEKKKKGIFAIRNEKRRRENKFLNP